MVYQTGQLYNYLKNELGLNETNINYKKAPEGIKYDWLRIAMLGEKIGEKVDKKKLKKKRDLRIMLDEIEQITTDEKLRIEALWPRYAKIMFPPNNFGLYVEKKNVKHMKFSIKITPKDNPIPLPPVINRELLEKITVKRSRSNKTHHTLKPPRVRGGGGGKKTRKLKKQRGGANKSIIGAGFTFENYPTKNSPLRKIDPLSLWTMQIPDNNDRLKLFQHFAYMMYELEIDTIIDLHSCGTGLHPNGKSPGFEGCYKTITKNEKENKELYINSERETWEFLKKIDTLNINNDNIKFLDDSNGISMEDYSPGNLNTWFNLSEQPTLYSDDDNFNLAVHCQSGYGRSGIVALFFLLRDCYSRYDITLPYLGKKDSSDMLEYLHQKLAFREQKNEIFFDLITVSDARLCVARINSIILALAEINNIKNFYLYVLPGSDLTGEALASTMDDFASWDSPLLIPSYVEFEKIDNGERTIEEIEGILRDNKFLMEDIHFKPTIEKKEEAAEVEEAAEDEETDEDDAEEAESGAVDEAASEADEEEAAEDEAASEAASEAADDEEEA